MHDDYWVRDGIQTTWSFLTILPSPRHRAFTCLFENPPSPKQKHGAFLKRKGIYRKCLLHKRTLVIIIFCYIL